MLKEGEAQLIDSRDFPGLHRPPTIGFHDAQTAIKATAAAAARPFRDGYTVSTADEVPAGDVTLSDIASFRPTPGIDRMEPNGWMVVGLDTNFYADTTTHTITGTLLGRPASVKFIPVGYHWNYGDNTTRDTTNKGTTWAKQRAREFDRTPTSHIYKQPGTYTITLNIDYAAHYTYNTSDWKAITGTIRLPANDLTARAGHVKTVLVNQDCNQNPTGIGCTKR